MTQKIPSFLSFKKFTTRDTLDGGAVFADVYIGKLKIGSYSDEGNGGGSSFDFVSDAASYFFEENVANLQLRELVLSQNPSLYSVLSDISAVDIVDEYVDIEFSRRERIKEAKSLLRHVSKRLVASNGMQIHWKGAELARVARSPSGQKVLQNGYDKLIKSLSESDCGTFIVNTVEQLTSLGIKVQADKHGSFPELSA